MTNLNKVENMKKSKIKDIYEGKELQVWEDGNFITLSLGLTTIAIPYDVWDDVKKDFKEFVEAIESK